MTTAVENISREHPLFAIAHRLLSEEGMGQDGDLDLLVPFLESGYAGESNPHHDCLELLFIAHAYEVCDAKGWVRTKGRLREDASWYARYSTLLLADVPRVLDVFDDEQLLLAVGNDGIPAEALIDYIDYLYYAIDDVTVLPLRFVALRNAISARAAAEPALFDALEALDDRHAEVHPWTLWARPSEEQYPGTE